MGISWDSLAGSSAGLPRTCSLTPPAGAPRERAGEPVLARELLLLPSGDGDSSGAPVKKIEAIISDSKLQEVRELLARSGVDGMTVSDVRGYGKARGQTELYRSSEHERPYLQRVKIEIVVEDGRAPALVEDLVKVAWTGRVGDGKIFVVPIEDAVRIRTNERGQDAI